MGFDQIKLIRATRLWLTAMILFFITWYYSLSESAWSLITIWFVMYEYTTVGGVFTKSFYRFAGTALSGAYGLMIIYFFDNNAIINLIAMLPAVFLYTYYFMDTDKIYIAVIGSVTLTIVLINYNDIDVAVLRTYNIFIGILGSMFMIRFFLPQYAKDKLVECQIAFIDHMFDIFNSYLDLNKPLTLVITEYWHHEQIMLEKLNAFNRFSKEAKIETINFPQYVSHHNQAVKHIRNLYRLLSVFICYLSVEETRQDKWVRANLKQLLTYLETISNPLLLARSKTESIEHYSLESLPKFPPAKSSQLKFLETLLKNMYQEALQLQNAIIDIALLHRQFKHDLIIISR